MKKNKKLLRRFLFSTAVVFIVINLFAILHAYKFTHFSDGEIVKTGDPEELTLTQKISTLIAGVNNPRPKNSKVPDTEYETIRLKSNREIECWSIQSENSKGTVILFHGFSGEKSAMLEKAALLRRIGFNTLLVDFMGSGGSEGNQTTIGFLEALQVKTCYDYLRKKGEKNIFLFGTSMGAVAIMKAINYHQLNPEGIILECPFGSMYETVSVRFRIMNIPKFPMAGIMLFWGGVINGFWAFDHRPVEYARSIQCPTLLIYGAKDEKVSINETEEIFANIRAPKKLSIYENAGHNNYLDEYENEWVRDLETFLTSFQKTGNSTEKNRN